MSKTVGVVVSADSVTVVTAVLSDMESLTVGSLVIIIDCDRVLLGRVVRLARRNIFQDDRVLQRIDYESVKLLEEYGIDAEKLTSMNLARIVILGQVTNNEKIEPSRRPPRLYSPVKLPDKTLLENILRPRSRLVIHVGKLRDLDTVDVYLDAEKLVTHHCAILAATGGGKSWLAGVIVEELAYRTDMSIIVFDPHSEYSSMLVPADEAGVELDEQERKIAEVIASKVKIYVPGRVDSSSIDEVFRRRFGRSRTYSRFGIRPLDVPLSIIVRLLDYYYGLSDTQRRILEEAWHNLIAHGDITDVEELLKIIEEEGRQAAPRGYAGEASLHSLLTKLRLLFENRPFFLTRLVEYYDGLPVRRLDIRELVEEPGVKVFDLSGLDYVDQQALVAVIVDQVLKFVMRHRSNSVLFVIEEAHNFAPSRGDSLSLGPLLKVAREGRKFGVGLLVISQRPARVHPDLLSQCMTQIFKRMVNPNDLKYVRDVLENVDVEDLWELKLLREDEALIVGLAAPLSLLVKVRKRYTAHGGLTPSIANLAETFGVAR